MNKALSKTALTVLSAAYLAVFSVSAQAASTPKSFQVATMIPVVLQLDIKSTCTKKGAEFKISNKGGKWPQTAILRLYTTHDKSLISQRRMRLALGQKVTLVVKRGRMHGQSVGVWVDPHWYKRDFKFDAMVNCN
ncbi:MAG: hypothetical protein JKY92_01430 [Magnetovibrio sp.]|nr:hypothetical protein [Magnetovibrio sp.]